MASSFLFYAAMYGVLFLLPQYLQAALGFGPLSAALRLLPWTSTLFLTAPVAGAVVQKFGERMLVVTGLLMQAAGFVWIIKLAGDHAGYLAFAAPFVIAGVGISMTLPSLPAAGLNSVPEVSGMPKTRSHSVAVAGSLTALTAAVYPAGPEPMMMTSRTSVTCARLLGESLYPASALGTCPCWSQEKRFGLPTAQQILGRGDSHGQPASGTDTMTCGRVAVQPSPTTHTRLEVAMTYAGVPW